MQSDRSVTPVTETVTGELGCNGTGDVQLASLDDYLDPDGRKYIPRSEPDKLNWGPWMSADELASARLKANRVTIPGDWDYQDAAPAAV